MVKRKRSNDNSTLAKSDKLPYLDRYLKTIAKEINKYSITSKEYSTQRGGDVHDLVVWQFDSIVREKELLHTDIQDKINASKCKCGQSKGSSYKFCNNINCDSNYDNIFEKNICENYGELYTVSNETTMLGGRRTGKKNFRIDRDPKAKAVLRLSSMDGSNEKSRAKRSFTVGKSQNGITLQEIYLRRNSVGNGRLTIVSDVFSDEKYDFSFGYDKKWDTIRYGISHPFLDFQQQEVNRIPVNLTHTRTIGNFSVTHAGEIIIKWDEGGKTYYDNIVNFYCKITVPYVKHSISDLNLSGHIPDWLYTSFDQSTAVYVLMKGTEDARLENAGINVLQQYTYKNRKEKIVKSISKTQERVQKLASLAHQNKFAKDKAKAKPEDNATMPGNQQALVKSSWRPDIFKYKKSISNILYIYINALHIHSSKLQKKQMKIDEYDPDYVHVLYQIYKEYSGITIDKGLYNKYLDAYKILINYLSIIIEIIQLINTEYSDATTRNKVTTFEAMRNKCKKDLEAYNDFFSFIESSSSPHSSASTTQNMDGGGEHRFYIKKIDDETIEIRGSSGITTRDDYYTYRTNVLVKEPLGEGDDATFVGIKIKKITYGNNKNILSRGTWGFSQEKKYSIDGEGPDAHVKRVHAAPRRSEDLGPASSWKVHYVKVDNDALLFHPQESDLPAMNIWEFYTQKLKPSKQYEYTKKVAKETATKEKKEANSETDLYNSKHSKWTKYLENLFDHNRKYLHNQIWEEMNKLKIEDFAKYYLPYIYFNYEKDKWTSSFTKLAQSKYNNSSAWKLIKESKIDLLDKFFTINNEKSPSMDQLCKSEPKKFEEHWLILKGRNEIQLGGGDDKYIEVSEDHDATTSVGEKRYMFSKLRGKKMGYKEYSIDEPIREGDTTELGDDATIKKRVRIEKIEINDNKLEKAIESDPNKKVILKLNMTSNQLFLCTRYKRCIETERTKLDAGKFLITAPVVENEGEALLFGSIPIDILEFYRKRKFGDKKINWTHTTAGTDRFDVTCFVKKYYKKNVDEPDNRMTNLTYLQAAFEDKTSILYRFDVYYIGSPKQYYAREQRKKLMKLGEEKRTSYYQLQPAATPIQISKCKIDISNTHHYVFFTLKDIGSGPEPRQRNIQPAKFVMEDKTGGSFKAYTCKIGISHDIDIVFDGHSVNKNSFDLLRRQTPKSSDYDFINVDDNALPDDADADEEHKVGFMLCSEYEGCVKNGIIPSNNVHKTDYKAIFRNFTSYVRGTVKNKIKHLKNNVSRRGTSAEHIASLAKLTDYQAFGSTEDVKFEEFSFQKNKVVDDYEKQRGRKKKPLKGILSEPQYTTNLDQLKNLWNTSLLDKPFRTYCWVVWKILDITKILGWKLFDTPSANESITLFEQYYSYVVQKRSPGRSPLRKGSGEDIQISYTGQRSNGSDIGALDDLKEHFKDKVLSRFEKAAQEKDMIKQYLWYFYYRMIMDHIRHRAVLDKGGKDKPKYNTFLRKECAKALYFFLLETLNKYIDLANPVQLTGMPQIDIGDKETRSKEAMMIMKYSLGYLYNPTHHVGIASKLRKEATNSRTLSNAAAAAAEKAAIAAEEAVTDAVFAEGADDAYRDHTLYIPVWSPSTNITPLRIAEDTKRIEFDVNVFTDSRENSYKSINGMVIYFDKQPWISTSNTTTNTTNRNILIKMETQHTAIIAALEQISESIERANGQVTNQDDVIRKSIAVIVRGLIDSVKLKDHDGKKIVKIFIKDYLVPLRTEGQRKSTPIISEQDQDKNYTIKCSKMEIIRSSGGKPISRTENIQCRLYNGNIIRIIANGKASWYFITQYKLNKRGTIRSSSIEIECIKLGSSKRDDVIIDKPASIFGKRGSYTKIILWFEQSRTYVVKLKENKQLNVLLDLFEDAYEHSIKNLTEYKERGPDSEQVLIFKDKDMVVMRHTGNSNSTVRDNKYIWKLYTLSKEVRQMVPSNSNYTYKLQEIDTAVTVLKLAEEKDFKFTTDISETDAISSNFKDVIQILQNTSENNTIFNRHMEQYINASKKFKSSIKQQEIVTDSKRAANAKAEENEKAVANAKAAANAKATANAAANAKATASAVAAAAAAAATATEATAKEQKVTALKLKYPILASLFDEDYNLIQDEFMNYRIYNNSGGADESKHKYWKMNGLPWLDDYLYATQEEAPGFIYKFGQTDEDWFHVDDAKDLIDCKGTKIGNKTLYKPGVDGYEPPNELIFHKNSDVHKIKTETIRKTDQQQLSDNLHEIFGNAVTYTSDKYTFVYLSNNIVLDRIDTEIKGLDSLVKLGTLTSTQTAYEKIIEQIEKLKQSQHKTQDITYNLILWINGKVMFGSYKYHRIHIDDTGYWYMTTMKNKNRHYFQLTSKPNLLLPPILIQQQYAINKYIGNNNKRVPVYTMTTIGNGQIQNKRITNIRDYSLVPEQHPLYTPSVIASMRNYVKEMLGSVKTA
jgi:hypothetical protein